MVSRLARRTSPTPRCSAAARVNEIFTSPGRAGSASRPASSLRCQNRLGTASVSGAMMQRVGRLHRGVAGQDGGLGGLGQPGRFGQRELAEGAGPARERIKDQVGCVAPGKQARVCRVGPAGTGRRRLDRPGEHPGDQGQDQPGTPPPSELGPQDEPSSGHGFPFADRAAPAPRRPASTITVGVRPLAPSPVLSLALHCATPARQPEGGRYHRGWWCLPPTAPWEHPAAGAGEHAGVPGPGVPRSAHGTGFGARPAGTGRVTRPCT